MTKLRLYQVDSFTRDKFRGNPAGVVANADGLTERQMQEIAREMNLSETAFIFSARDDQHDVHVRFFTPTVEVPICGHATIASHYVRAVEGTVTSGTVHQLTGAGILAVEIDHDGIDYRIWMTQGTPEFASVISGRERSSLLKGLGVSEGDIADIAPIQIVSTGHSKVMIPLGRRDVLNGLTPDLSALTAASQALGCNGFFAFTLEGSDPGILAHGRMFAPAIGIAEDPVTGNANGPLGAYLVHHGVAQLDAYGHYSFHAKQGEAINRAGTVEVAVKQECPSAPMQVRIAGNATIVFRTELDL